MTLRTDLADGTDSATVHPGQHNEANAVLLSLVEVGRIFDLNAAPYNLVPNDNTGSVPANNAAGVTQFWIDALAYVAANGGQVQGLYDDEDYWFGGTFDTSTGTNGISYNTLIPIPIVPQSDQQGVVYVGPKGGPRVNALPYFTQGRGKWRFGGTSGSYDATHGCPSIMGGTARKNGFTVDITKASWFSMVLNIAWEQPADPTVACFDATWIDRLVLLDGSFTTDDVVSGGHYPTEPTHPTGVAFYPPMDALDGYELRGNTTCIGYYGGIPIGELMSNQGVLYALENVVAHPIYDAFTHMANLGHCIPTRNPYVISGIDPSSGISSISKTVGSDGICIAGLFDLERMISTGTWHDVVYDVNDPNDAFTGEFRFLKCLAGGGNNHGGLLFNGGQHLRTVDMGKPGSSLVRHLITTGDYSITNASWGNLDTGTDITIAADDGDTIEVGLNGLWGNSAVFSAIDVVSIISGSPVNSLSGVYPTSGVAGWQGINGAYTNLTGTLPFTVTASDIDTSGNVTLRIRVILGGAGSKTLYADTGNALAFWARNLGRV